MWTRSRSLSVDLAGFDGSVSILNYCDRNENLHLERLNIQAMIKCQDALPDESGGRCDYGIRLLVVLRDDGDELHDVGHVLQHQGQLRRDGRVGGRRRRRRSRSGAGRARTSAATPEMGEPS